MKVKQHDSRFVRSLVSLRSLEDLEKSAEKESPATMNATVGNGDEEATEEEGEEAKAQVMTLESPDFLPFKPKRPLQLEGTGLKTLNLTGCLLAEDMLMFTMRKPIRLASSLVTLSPQEFYAWSRHYMLHRVIETALKSPAVPVERKRQIYTILLAFCIVTCLCVRPAIMATKLPPADTATPDKINCTELPSVEREFGI
ncbi:unnamed protein product [Dibothriocephalus latus]|uniref:Uncharacterized protein n=1 Tax=Dibothriocephalus latus TaxID=60516 RepID=A0A3P7M5Z9_DIBLA|nr:unnamed protein product [Dibothriocephalus latus]